MPHHQSGCRSKHRRRGRIIAEGDQTASKFPNTSYNGRKGWLYLNFLLLGWLVLVLVGQSALGQGQSVASVSPAADSVVSNLTVVTVTFTQPVVGVQPEDLMLNGNGSTNVTGGGATYSFGFAQPGPGLVEASWNGAHNIRDLSGNRLNDLGAGTVWDYTLVDVVAPVVSVVSPAPGATLSHLTQIAVTFSEPVVGVDASDLLVNGQPASQVSGEGSGPYTFGFGAPGSGVVEVRWAVNHGITDLALSPNGFGGGSWSYTLHPGEFSGNVVINEFLAANVSTNGLRDEDGDLADWIELYNRGGVAVNLGGWSLTDDPEQPGLWVFPGVSLGAGEYLVVYASGKDRSPANGGHLHTSFKLSTAGQYLGLFNANFPREVATQFVPGYPEQRADLAYGLYGGSFGYLTNASPGVANSGPAVFSGLAAEPAASVGSGLFDRGFGLTLSTVTPGASIRYTLDGSEPTPSSAKPATSRPVRYASSGHRRSAGSSITPRSLARVSRATTARMHPANRRLTRRHPTTAMHATTR